MSLATFFEPISNNLLLQSFPRQVNAVRSGVESSQEQLLQAELGYIGP